MDQKQQREPRRNKITSTQKRWLLSIHLLFIATWLGSGFSSLVCLITALTTTDPHLLHTTYVLADTLDKTISRGGAAGTLLTGILLATLTPWGLLRFYWLNVKEVVALTCVAVDFIVIRWSDHVVALTATPGFQALSNPSYLTNRTLLFVGILVRISALAAVIVVSIFKPWGQRKRAPERSMLRVDTVGQSEGAH